MVKTSLEVEHRMLYDALQLLKCRLLAYLLLTNVQISVSVETNSELLSRILELHNNRRVNFWRDFIVLMETKDLMTFITENIEEN